MTGKLNTKHHILLGEYTLGLLNQPETAQAHNLLGSDESAVATALAWEEQLLALTDLLPPVDPSPLLLQRIQTALGHDTTPAPSSLYRQPDSNTQASDAAASSTSAAASVAPGKPIQTARPEPEPEAARRPKQIAPSGLNPRSALKTAQPPLSWLMLQQNTRLLTAPLRRQASSRQPPKQQQRNLTAQSPFCARSKIRSHHNKPPHTQASGAGVLPRWFLH